MKKTCFVCVFLLMFLYFSVAIDTSYAIQTIKVAGDNNYPPYEYVDKNGIYKGFNVDVMRAIALELGIEIELIPMNWSNAINALETGKVDAIQGMIKSDSRDITFDFSNALLTNAQAIFVLKEKNHIAELQDLNNTKVAFQRGDISEEIVSDIEDVESYGKNNQEESMEALLKGEVDVVIGNRLTGLYILQKYENYNKVKIVGEPIHKTEYMAATLDGNEDILDILNIGIREIKENGTYDKIYKKWFGQTFEDPNAVWKRLVYITTLILFFVIIFTGIIFYWNLQLKKKVAKRTSELNNMNKKLKEKSCELEQSNMVRGNILENIINGIIGLNLDKKVFINNKAASNILETEIEIEMEWQELGLSKLIHTKRLEQALKGKVWKENLEWIDSSANKKYIECNLIPIKSDNQKVDGIIVLLWDYSEIKKMRDVVYHADKMQSLGRLAAGIAHEIRNPLTSIKALIDLLPNKFESEKYRKNITAVVPEEIQRINNLVTLLLDYSKPKTTVLRQNSVFKIIDNVLNLVTIDANKRNVQIIFNKEESIDADILCDEQQIQQVFVNLVLNSIESIDSNGEVKIYTAVENENIVVKVADNGSGIPADVLDKIFDPFFTLKSNGYGLGLSISFQLVKDNNGTIKFNSEIGKGTIASIYLPVAKGEEIYA